MSQKFESHNLDFLRSIAVGLVVSRHVMPALHIDGTDFFRIQFLGILGVLIFFVHTCLVLMFSMEQQRTRNNNLYFTFIVRRFFRIYPLSIAVVATVALTAIVWPSNPILHSIQPWEFVTNLLLIQNLTNTPNVIGPLWSLPIEVQMYLFLPLLFLGAKRKNSFRFLLLVIWPLFVLFAFLQYKIAFPLSEMWRYAPCFIPGAIAYSLFKSNLKAFIPFWALPTLLFLSLALYMVLGSYSQTIGGYPICLAIGLSLPFITPIRNVVAISVFKTIAKYSYSIYLLHGPCILVVFNCLPNASVPVKLAIFTAALTGLSYLTFHLIESPMISLGNKIVARKSGRGAEVTSEKLAESEPTPVP